MKALWRALVIAVAVLALAGGSARGDSFCAEAGATYPGPGGAPMTLEVGPYCVPVP